MAEQYTCGCGFVTNICRDEVSAEQWQTFETLYRFAYDWASDHLPTDDPDEAEAFACRYAGEEWDSDEPCSFPVFLRCEEAAAERAESKRRAADILVQRAEAKRRDAKWRADRRRQQRAAARS